MILTAEGERVAPADGEHVAETTWEPDGHMVTARCSCGVWVARTCFWPGRVAREQVERIALVELHDRRTETGRRRRPS